ncbi:MAG: hypothetical protein KatS3mg115_0928 [Candidatus Poribacteria bacterium]|nr:MAG: hypothetical protein KatS3mg115_0928 [Candidatus Poribacteria bacterium]
MKRSVLLMARGLGALLVLVLVAVEGCAPSGGGRLPRSVQQHRERLRVETYRVLDAGLGAQGDGYTFRSQRFVFTFDRAFDTIAGFRTPEERYERGKEAHAVLEGGYAFVRDLFGIEASKPIRVVILPALDGDPGDAKTVTEWKTLDGKILDGSEEVTMYFGYRAFQHAPTLAHELAHALLGVYALPAWLNEGIATLVEVDYAKGRPLRGTGRFPEPLGFDPEGYNIIETWRGDGNPLPFRSGETYSYAYAIVKELQRRYGEDVFVRFFAELKRTKPHLQGTLLTSEQIVDVLERLVGPEVREFFAKTLRFRVRPYRTGESDASS